MRFIQDQVSGVLGMKSDMEQLIHPLQTELSSLKSELSADHENKTQDLENVIKEQSDRICSLQDQVSGVLGTKSDMEQLILPLQSELLSLKSELSADHENKTQDLENVIKEQSDRICSLQDQVSGVLGTKSDMEQLILPLQSELSSLKSELSADHENKTQDLENVIKEQSDRICSLQDRVEQMKVGSPPVACHEADFSSCSWLSNEFVAVRDGVMQRIGDIDQKNYSFRSTPFAVDSKITFMISEVGKQFGESLTFGTTIYSADHLDMQSLPVNGQKMRISSTSSFWHIANDFIPAPKEKQIICLMRTSDGVLMKTETEERLLFAVDPFVCVFPFFLFDGSVEAIQFREFKVHNREKLECLICLDKVASTRVKPCGHILYCDDCRSGAIICRDDSNCPLCRTVITKYKQIRTD